MHRFLNASKNAWTTPDSDFSSKKLSPTLVTSSVQPILITNSRSPRLLGNASTRSNLIPIQAELLPFVIIALSMIARCCSTFNSRSSPGWHFHASNYHLLLCSQMLTQSSHVVVSLLVDNGDLVPAVFPLNQKTLFGVASGDPTDPMPPCVTLPPGKLARRHSPT